MSGERVPKLISRNVQPIVVQTRNTPGSRAYNATAVLGS